MTKKETESERARTQALREKLPADLQAKITELDQQLVTFLAKHDAESGPDSEDDTAIRDLRDKVAQVIAAGSVHPSMGTIGPAPIISTMPDPQANTIPSPPPTPPPITRPAVTRPTLEALAQSRTEPTSQREPDYPPISPMPHSGGRIIIIDDDPGIRDILVDVLREEGYRVCPAENGEEGLKRLFQMPDCDLVLLDLMMPKMTGFEFLDIFDSNPQWTMPVVILSAHIKDKDYHPGPGGGLEVFIGEKPREALKKPFYLEAFLQTIKEKVREGKLRRKMT